ncbi:MAG: tetratricopeptide repeat protein [DPANN group archaeon]|nr:tetratricopeptide repeat protein [DPANN group archaeon]
MASARDRVHEILRRHGQEAQPAPPPAAAAVDPVRDKVMRIVAGREQAPEDAKTDAQPQTLKDKILDMASRPQMHVPIAGPQVKRDSIAGLEDVIRRGLPRDEAAPDKAERVKLEIQDTLRGVLKIVSVLATGSVSFDFSSIRNSIAYELGVDVSPEYAALLNALVSNTPKNTLTNFLAGKNIDNLGLLKRLCVLDFFVQHITSQDQLQNLLTREPLSHVTAYLAYAMPNIYRDVSRHSSYNVRVESARPLEKGPIEERTEAVLIAMLNNPNSRILIRRVTTLGELKELMVIDELLEYLRLNGVEFGLDFFLRPNVEIYNLHYDLNTKIKEVLYDPNTASADKLTDLRRLQNTASLCALLGDYDKASTFYENLIKSDPTNEYAVVNFEKFLCSYGDFGRALGVCNSFLRVKQSKIILEEKSIILKSLAGKSTGLARLANSVNSWRCAVSANSLKRKWEREYFSLKEILEKALADPNINLKPLLGRIEADGPTLNALMDVADLLIANGNKAYFDGAYKVVLKASRLAPKNERCIYELGRIAFEIDWFYETISHLKRLKKSFRDSKLLLGMAYYRESNFGKALNALDSWLKENPQDLQGLRYRGHVHMAMKKTGLARKDYVSALRIQASGDVHFSMGQIELGKKDLQTAAMHFEKAADLNFNKLESLINAAKCHYNLGANERACEQLQLVLTNNNNIDALLLICDVLNRLKSKDGELIDYCNRALAVQPQNEEINKIKETAVLRNAERARQRKDFDGARTMLTDTITASPSNAAEPHRQMLGVLWQKSGSGDRSVLPEVISHADSILKINRGDVFALHYKALAQKELGSPGVADTLETILQHAPDNLFALKELGNIRLASGEHRQAIELYEYFMRFNPQTDVAVINNLSSAHHNAGELDRALYYIRMAKARDDSTDTLSNEVAILGRLKRYDEIAAVIDRATKEGKKLPDNLCFIRARLFQKAGDKKSLEKAYSIYEYIISKNKEVNGEWLEGCAEVALQLGQNQKALDSLDALVNLDRSNPDVHIMHAQAVLGVGNYSADAKAIAVKDLYVALHKIENLQSEPTQASRVKKPAVLKLGEPELRKKLAQLLHDLSRHDEVIDVLSQYPQRHEDEVARLLLDAHINLKDNDNAAKLAREIISQPRVSTGLKSLAYVLLGDISATRDRIEFYRKATELSPGPGAFYKYATALRDNGDLETALAACARAKGLGSKESLQLEKDIGMKMDGRDWNKKGDEAMLSNNFEEAIRCFDEAMRCSGQTRDILNKKANAEERAKKIGPVLATLETLMAEGDTNAALHRGDLLLESDDYAGAIACYDTVLATDPNNDNANYGKANSLFKSGDVRSASVIAMDACRRNITHIRTWFLAGLANENLANYAEAVNYYSGCLKLKPDEQTLEIVLTNKGNCLLALKRTADARRAYERVLKLNRNSDCAIGGLAEVHELAGELDTALDYISRAIKLEPQEDYYSRVKVRILDKLNRPADAAAVIMEMENAAPE